MDRKHDIVPVPKTGSLAPAPSGALVKSYDVEPKPEEDVRFVEEAQARRLAIDEEKLRITKSLQTVQAELRAMKRHSADAQDTLYQAKAVVEDLKHWKDWVRANPGRSVGIGFALGLGLGLF